MSINPPSPQSNGGQSSNNWTEPPWTGWIETTGDALLILEAARRGLIPRVTRRLVDSERKMITSGSVFVFDEDESGIKRWTDGFFWSPSRILGNFLLYRETDKRGSGHRARSDGNPAESSNALLVTEQQQYGADGSKVDSQTLSRPKGEIGGLGIDRHRERSLVGSLTNSYKFKPDGMMKKTFSLTIGGVSQHLISYYKIEDVEQGRLRTPSSLPELAALDISPEYLDKTHFRNPPKVETGIDGIPRYRGESDESDPSPRTTTAPLSTGLPLLLDSRMNAGMSGSDGGSSPVGKRGKRFDPYGGNASSGNSKRQRKSKTASQPSSESQSPVQQHNPSPVTPHTQTPYGAPDQNVPPHPHFAPYGVPMGNYYQLPHPGYPIHPPPPHPMYAPPTPASPFPAGNNPSGSGAPQQSPGGASDGTTPTPPATASAAPGTPSPTQAATPYPVYATPGEMTSTQPSSYSYYPAPPGHYPGYNGMPPWQYSYAPQQGVVAQQPGMEEKHEEGTNASGNSAASGVVESSGDDT